MISVDKALIPSNACCAESSKEVWCFHRLYRWPGFVLLLLFSQFNRILPQLRHLPFSVFLIIWPFFPCQDSNFSTALELAVRFGKTLVIQEMDGVEPVLYPILRGDFISQGKRVSLVIFSREGGVILGVQHRLAFSTLCVVTGSV